MVSSVAFTSRVANSCLQCSSHIWFSSVLFMHGILHVPSHSQDGDCQILVTQIVTRVVTGIRRSHGLPYGLALGAELTSAVPARDLAAASWRFYSRQRFAFPIERCAMKRFIFFSTISLLCALGVSAQQRNIDTQKSTLTIHVGKTGLFSGLEH